MNTSLTALVEQAVLDQMRARASFTALDISNRLKAERYPVQHRQVAETVREIFDSGAMAHYDYDRESIPVVTDGGAKTTSAFLYHFQEVRPCAYQARSQSALPPVPPDQARDLSDAPTAGAALLPSRPARFPRCRGRRTRRDGALGIPKSLLAQLGWTDGTRLALTVNDGRLVIEAWSTGAEELRVWEGQRLRICRTKLHGGALTAESALVAVDGAALSVSALNEAKGNGTKGGD